MSKILHISQRYWPALGGAELFVKTIAEHNLNQGHEVEVWTTDADDPDSLWDSGRKKFEIQENEIVDGMRVRRFKVSNFITDIPMINKGIRYILSHIPNWKLQVISFPPYIPDMYKEINSKELDYDIIHVSCMPYSSIHYVAMEIARKCNAKLYMTPFQHVGVKGNYSAEDKYYHPRVVPFFNRADKVFVQTQAEYDEILNYMKKYQGYRTYNSLVIDNILNQQVLLVDNISIVYKIAAYLNSYIMKGLALIFKIIDSIFGKKIKIDFDESKLELVGLGIYPKEVSGGNGDRFRKEWNISKDEKIIFYVGARTSVKGVFNLVKAFEQVLKKDDDIRLVLAGPTTSEFENFYNSVPKDVKAKVILINGILDQKKRDLFDAGDVFSMVSKSDSFGIVYLESWINNKPVISSDIEAMKYVVDDGIDGYRVNFDDIDTIAKTIIKLLKDSELRNKLGSNGYEKVMKKYTWDIKFKILDKYFNE